MDVVFLQQRVEFLEKSLEILLDKHQLKGLYLLRLKKKEVDEKYEQHKLRDKMVYFYQQAFERREGEKFDGQQSYETIHKDKA